MQTVKGFILCDKNVHNFSSIALQKIHRASLLQGKEPIMRKAGFPIQSLYIRLMIQINMSTVTVNISFQNSLLNEIDKTAKKEHRSRSELLREAARLYIQRQQQWDDLFQLGERITEEKQLTLRDVEDEIKSARQEKRGS
ncbi:MAG: ribbon-helix-helix domain-containing protein [Chlorobiales bacterium]|nr:ribbon-helix-helix domain-containing protein [Chlorobiales bacterium]